MAADRRGQHAPPAGRTRRRRSVRVGDDPAERRRRPSRLREHRIAVGLYDHEQDGIVRRRRVEIDVSGERTDLPELVGEQQPDLLLLNDDDLTFAKVRLDERSRQTVVRGIGRISSSLARALCWTAATDMLRDAELPTRDYIELVLAGVERESDVSVVQTVLAAARMAIHQYADPPDRLMLLARWASATPNGGHRRTRQ